MLKCFYSMICRMDKKYSEVISQSEMGQNFIFGKDFDIFQVTLITGVS